MRPANLRISKSINGFPMPDERKHAFEQVIGHMRAARDAREMLAEPVPLQIRLAQIEEWKEKNRL
jgi:hypothetical protein